MTLADWKPFLIVIAVGLLGVLLYPWVGSEDGPPAFRMLFRFEQSVSDCCTSHPDWERTACERIAREEIWVGMTEEMVHASLGEPRQIDHPDSEDASRADWIYLTPRYGHEILQLCDGILIGWSPPPTHCIACRVKPPRPQP